MQEILDRRNALALVLDPSEPHPTTVSESKANTYALLHTMDSADLIEFQARLERLYRDVCIVVKQRGVSPSAFTTEVKKRFQPLGEAVEEAREALANTGKRAKIANRYENEREKRITVLMALGKSRTDAIVHMTTEADF